MKTKIKRKITVYSESRRLMLTSKATECLERGQMVVIFLSSKKETNSKTPFFQTLQNCGIVYQKTFNVKICMNLNYP